MPWWVQTHHQLKEVVRDFSNLDEFVIDVETKGQYPLDPRRNEVYWAVLAGPDMTVPIPFGHPNGEQIGWAKEPRTGKDEKVRNFKVPVYAPPPSQLRPADVFEILEPLLFSDRRIIGHNIKFDMESIAKYYDGQVPPGPYGDTEGAAFLLNENLRKYNLNDCVGRSFGAVLDKSITAKLHTLPFKTVLTYVFRDGRYNWLLWPRLSYLLKQQGLWTLFEFEMDVIAALLDMEPTGITADRQDMESMAGDLDGQLEELTGKLYRIAGREWNFNSPQQRADVFYSPKAAGGQGLRCRKFTAKGAQSCDDDALEYHIGNPLVDAYREYQDVAKLANTYVKAWLGTNERKTTSKRRNNAPPLNPHTGRIHANFRPFGTVTGRFSCSEPNLQNIPRGNTELGKRMRQMFIASPGNMLVVADYSQIEYVIMAHYSRDPRLVQAFLDGVDFHLFVASDLLGIVMDDITRTQRDLAKNTNFAVAYGAGVDKVAAMSKVSLKEAERFRDNHRATYRKLYAFTEDVVKVARARKPVPYVKTLLGRRRRLPAMLWRDDNLRAGAERQAVNSVIQGSAADINKLALIRLNELRDRDMHILLNVHDEIVFEVPERKADLGHEILREAMLGDGVQELLSVPLKADSHVVSRWGDAK